MRKAIARSACAVAATVAAIVLGYSAPAYASPEFTLNITTLNRPSTVEWGSTEYVGWADTSANGFVNIDRLNSSLGVSAHWQDTNYATYYGTGPTITASNGAIVFAYVDQGEQAIHLGEINANSMTRCEITLDTYGWEQLYVNSAPTSFGYPNSFQATSTPYLTSEGDDGSGRLYLTWTTANGSSIYVAGLTAPTPSQCASGNFQDGSDGWRVTSMVSLGQASWDGPAMVVSGYGTSSERYWVMWAGLADPHLINIAEYTTSWGRISMTTESNHWTKTDIGGAYATHPREGSPGVWMSYCGTNNVVYYQEFTTTNGGVETALSGASCKIYPYNGFYSGGVGISYDYTSGEPLLTWNDESTLQIHGFYLDYG